MARNPNADSERNAADGGSVADFYFIQQTESETGFAAVGETGGRTATRGGAQAGGEVVGSSTGLLGPLPLDPAAAGDLTDGGDPTRSEGPPQVNSLIGTQFNDVLYGYQANMPDPWTGTIEAFGGDDVIFRDRTGGYGGPDGDYHDVYINGGQGYDIVSYSGLTSSIAVDLNFGWAKQWAHPLATQFGFDHLNSIEGIIGTTHNDSMVGNASANDFWGHDGHDAIDGGGGNDRIWGGVGNDTLIGGGGHDQIEGNTGHDNISGGSGDDTIDGGSGNDTVSGGSDNDVIYGGSGNDEIEGGSGNDTIYDGDGSDDVKGGHGHDTIYLSDGNDTASGHTGNDVFHVSGFGDNVIYGGFNNDTVVYGNASVNVHLAYGTATRADGTDSLSGIENVVTGSGYDTVTGTGYANGIYTGSGNDVINGLGGDDTLDGGFGDDEIWGHADDDLIFGHGDDDVLHGDEGVDTIYGGSGDDTLDGGDGDDEMYGGTGTDVFVWNKFDTGYDHIGDFDVDEDKFSFGEGYFAGGLGPVNLSDVLLVWHLGDDCAIVANTAANGWQAVAFLEDVSGFELQERIDNGTILDVETTGLGGGAPGGFDFDQPFNVGETGTDFFL